MWYKPAYFITNSGAKGFVGNYDNLADLRYDYPNDLFECWNGDGCLYVRMLTPDEYRRRKYDAETPSGVVAVVAPCGLMMASRHGTSLKGRYHYVNQSYQESYFSHRHRPEQPRQRRVAQHCKVSLGSSRR